MRTRAMLGACIAAIVAAGAIALREPVLIAAPLPQPQAQASSSSDAVGRCDDPGVPAEARADRQGRRRRRVRSARRSARQPRRCAGVRAGRNAPWRHARGHAGARSTGIDARRNTWRRLRPHRRRVHRVRQSGAHRHMAALRAPIGRLVGHHPPAGSLVGRQPVSPHAQHREAVRRAQSVDHGRRSDR